MHHLSLGVKGESQVLVTGENAIGFLGPEGARVLSTPHMIGYMEFTCRNIALPLLETGYDTVGAHVDVKHLAAAPLGVTVRFLAHLLHSATQSGHNLLITRGGGLLGVKT